MANDADLAGETNVAHEPDLVPVWTLATEDTAAQDLLRDAEMTSERLTELRTALATFANTPIATLEMHPLVSRRDPAGGIALLASSPLAKELSQLMAQTARSVTTRVDVTRPGETLYRMVVPAKVASQVSKGLVKPMTSKAAAGGVYSALRDSKGIVSKATFVPVASQGNMKGLAATAGVGIAGAGALTVAAPLVLMAIAVGASAYADQKRQGAIEQITELLEHLRDNDLEQERNRLSGCRDAIDKATSVLLDQGKIGQSLGLDSAAHEINVAIEATRTRLQKWEDALTKLPLDGVELGMLTDAFPGILDENGIFSAHLQLAKLAIALKQRVLVLQAVEHAQLDSSNNPFNVFVAELQRDEHRLRALEMGVEGVLMKLGSLELKRPTGWLKGVHYKPKEVDNLLKAVYRLRALAPGLVSVGSHSDVEIEIERGSDGSVVVFPATAVEQTWGS